MESQLRLQYGIFENKIAWNSQLFFLVMFSRPIYCFYSAPFSRKWVRLLQWAIFLDARGPLFCSFVQQQKLERRMFKIYSKRQKLIQNKKNDIQNLKNTKDLSFGYLGVFHLDFFRHYETFCNKMDAKKPKGSSLLHFSSLWNCSKFSIFGFLPKTFIVSKGSPFIFSKFCHKLVSQSPNFYSFTNVALFEP